MACEITSGFDLGACKDGVGGVRAMYVANWDKVNFSASTVAAGAYTALEMIAVGDKFFTYNLTKQTSSLTENITVEPLNSTAFFEQTFNLIMNTMSVEKRNELTKLVRANVALIVELNQLGDDGAGNLTVPQYVVLGSRNGCDVNAGTTASGVAFGDRNGYDITFSGSEPESVLYIEKALVDVLIIDKV